LKIVPKNFEEPEELNSNKIQAIKLVDSQSGANTSTSSSPSCSKQYPSHHSSSSPKKRHCNYGTTTSVVNTEKETSYPILNAAIRRDLSIYQTNSNNTKLLADLIIPGVSVGSTFKLNKITSSIESMRDLNSQKVDEEKLNKMQVENEEGKGNEIGKSSQLTIGVISSSDIDNSKHFTDFGCQVDTLMDTIDSTQEQQVNVREKSTQS